MNFNQNILKLRDHTSNKMARDWQKDCHFLRMFTLQLHLVLDCFTCVFMYSCVHLSIYLFIYISLHPLILFIYLTTDTFIIHIFLSSDCGSG